ncbi:MAG: hypothetical protein AAF928_21210 [Myxococcota bacterium]
MVRVPRAAALVGALILLTTGRVAAHHASAAPSIEPTVSLLPQTGATMAPRSRASVVTRYLKLPDQTPSYLQPVAPPGDHVGILELGYTHAFCDYATMSLTLPLLWRTPAAADDTAIALPPVGFGAGLEEEEDTDGSRVGLGDLRLGTRVYPWLGARGSVSLAVDLSLPTAGVRPDDGGGVRFGTGDFIPRASVLWTHRIGEVGTWTNLGLSAEGGLSGALRPEGNAVADYGASVGWTPFEVFGVFAGVQARSFLRDDESGLAALRQFERAAGDTLVVLSPGARVTPVPDVVITAGPQLPLTTARDDEGGAILRLDVFLP